MRAIICCDCPGIPKRAEAAYKVKFKQELAPKAWAGQNMIATFLENVPQNTEIWKYAKALSKNHEKFAYYMEWGIDGVVSLQYNLLSGRRIK